MKAKDVLGLAKDRGAVMVDLKFMDFVGLWQHFTIPLAELKEEIFEEGLGFDGSSIRGIFGHTALHFLQYSQNSLDTQHTGPYTPLRQ